MIKDLTYSTLTSKIKLYSSTPISSYISNFAKSKTFKKKALKNKPLLRDSSTPSIDVNQNNGPSFDLTNKNLRSSLSTNCMTHSHSSLRYGKPVNKPKSSSSSRHTFCSIQRIITDNTKLFLESLDKKHPIFTIDPKNYNSDNLKDLQHMLSSLQAQTFEKIQNEIDEKKVIRAALESSIAEIHHLIYIYNNSKKFWEKENTKVLNQIGTIQSNSKKYVNDKHSIEEYKAGIQPLKEQADNLNSETLLLRAELLEEKVSIQHIEDEIRKYNKMITDIERERDILLITIQVIENHKKKITTRVQNTTQKNSDIMLKWTSFCKEVLKD